MAEFPITTARQRLGFDTSTAVPLGQVAADPGTGVAIGQAVLGGIEKISEIQQKRQQMEDTRSAIEADGLLDEAIKKNEAFRLTTTDTKAWANNLQQGLKAVETTAGQKPMSDNARSLWNAKFQAASRIATANSTIAETRREAKDTKDALAVDIRNSIRSGDEEKQISSVARAAQSELLSKVEVAAAIKLGQDDRTKDLVNGVHALIEAGEKTGDFGPATLAATSEDIPEKSQTVLRNSIRSSKRVFEDKNEAIQEANTTEFVLKIAEARDVAKQVPSVTIPEINEALRVGNISLKQRDSLIKRILQPPATDRVKQAELYTESLNIWRGTISKTEFDKKLNANANNLDDNSYRILAKSAADTLKSSQAESLSRANTEVIRVVVDFSEEDAFAKFVSDSIKGLDTDAAKLFEDNANENRQLQFWSVSRYNAELRQWIEDNPDKLGKDFSQFSEGLKHQYWNRSIEEIKVLKVEREAELRGERHGESKRVDGTNKGLGFLGPLKRPDGKISTELSIGVEFNGRETEIPSLVPTLTKGEIEHLLGGGKPTDGIVDKAVAHAKKRFKEGKSPFAQKGEQQTDSLPEPNTQSDWEAEVARLKKIDIEQARSYYNKWVRKWQ